MRSSYSSKHLVAPEERDADGKMASKTAIGESSERETSGTTEFAAERTGGRVGGRAGGFRGGLGGGGTESRKRCHNESNRI
jgi:hypothetical protein